MEITILPPKGHQLNEISHELKKLNNGFVDIATYPNGVEVVITYLSGKANVESSRPLIKIDEHTYQVPD